MVFIFTKSDYFFCNSLPFSEKLSDMKKLSKLTIYLPALLMKIFDLIACDTEFKCSLKSAGWRKKNMRAFQCIAEECNMEWLTRIRTYSANKCYQIFNFQNIAIAITTIPIRLSISAFSIPEMTSNYKFTLKKQDISGQLKCFQFNRTVLVSIPSLIHVSLKMK